jgi:hypothetical protein
MKAVYPILFFISICFAATAQEAIDVLESTIKVGGFGEEVFYLGFAEGDRLVFNFDEIDKKELKELEIVEWPGSTKFAEFKVKTVQNKTIDIQRTSIYKFRFANSAIGGRICKIHIRRIPANAASKHFNTNVYWRVINDTTYTPVAERYLVSSDTTISHVVDQITKVSSTSALNGNPNTSVVDMDLPEGTTAWSYYIGVGNEGKAAFDNATDKLLTTAAQQASKIEGYGTMAALAIHGLNLFAKAQGRDNVKYWIIPDWNNVLLFRSGQAFQAYKVGDVINDASKMERPLAGKIYLGLLNDNVMEPIEVVVKVTAVKIQQQWATRTIEKMKVTQRSEPFLK